MQEAFLEAVKSAITMSQANAMLGDGTITQPTLLTHRMSRSSSNNLETPWKTGRLEYVLKSTTEDMHRLYSTFTKEADKFYVSAYFGIQFHELPYTELIGASSKYRRAGKN